MFGPVEQMIDRNVAICLAVVAALLLLTGLVVCVVGAAARSHPGSAQPGTGQPRTGQPEPVRVAPASP